MSQVESRTAYCPSCMFWHRIYAGDPYVSHMGIKGYAMRCDACGHRWTEPLPEFGTEASLDKRDTDPITQPCEAYGPVDTKPMFCWRCGLQGEESQIWMSEKATSRLWCRQCASWLDEYGPEVA